jgi:hypothetical protein
MSNIRSRKISVKRLIDLILGGRVAGINESIDVELKQKYERILRKIEEDSSMFRTFITENTPALYIVDCLDISRTVIAEFSTGKTVKNYGTSGIKAEFGGKKRISEMFQEEIIDEGTLVDIPNLLSESMSQSGTEKELANALYKALISGTPTVEKVKTGGLQTGFTTEGTTTRQAISKGKLKTVFNDKIAKLYKAYRNEISKLMSSNSADSNVYQKIEALGVALGKQLREQLQDVSTFIAEDRVVALPNNLSVLIVANTFQAAVDAANKNLEAALRVYLLGKNKLFLEAIREYDPNNKKAKYFKFGDLVNAGHTAAYLQGSAKNYLIGVNMPGAQAVQQTISMSEAQDLEIDLGNLYVDINYDVKFLSSFGARATGALIDLQFAVAISMPAALNTKALKNAEVAIIKKYKKDAKDLLYKKLKSKNVEQIGKEYLPIASNSPNLIDNIEELLKQALLGKDYNYTSRNNSKVKLTVGTVKTSTKPRGNIKAVSKPGTKKGNTVKATYSTGYPKVKENGTNLSILLSRINGLLFEQIRKNMGTGNRRDVLNYQTGRFASSVKVERLSESREGMITAFYSYMKNPYATFSKGGRQERPLTRDPKLLIAKSIREIAQTAVANRMRAVNV